MNEANGGKETYMTIEEQGRVHRAVTGKMLEVVSKKLDTMNPVDLSQGTVTDWVETSIKAERDEAAGLVTGKDSKAEPKQGEINFTRSLAGFDENITALAWGKG
jgi:hypothetical protein